MYIISKEFYFSASHQLVNLPENHPCTRIHGHNYKVKVFLRSETLNDAGMVRDYHDLSIIKEYLDEAFDHTHLNEFLHESTTAENIARYIYEQFKRDLPELFAIEISETDKTSCRYEP